MANMLIQFVKESVESTESLENGGGSGTGGSATGEQTSNLQNDQDKKEGDQ